MPVLKGDILPAGILVDIQVGWSASGTQSLRAALRPIPPLVDAKAILDIGAETTGLDVSLVQTLGLVPSNFTLANFPAGSGMVIAREHEVGTTIVHPSGNTGLNLMIANWSIVELPLRALGYQALIGRDLLARCRLVYNGPRSRFRLAY